DQKKIQSESKTLVFIEDSLINKTIGTANYKIKVIDTAMNYTIQYTTESDLIDIETQISLTELDSTVNHFIDIIKRIAKETEGFNYELLVDKTSGQAFEVKNGDQYLIKVGEITSKIIDEMVALKASVINQSDSLKQNVKDYFKSVE